MNHDHTRLLVENILRHPQGFDWSVQGLAMLRTYLSKEIRLQVWDSALKVPGVSAIHSHAWDFDSLIVAGRYKQHRYKKIEDTERVSAYSQSFIEEFNLAQIKCGEGAAVTSEVQKVWLMEQPLETYIPGATYHQDKDELHLSVPEDGTTTIITRTFHPDRDHAFVAWRGKGGWTDAKPRKATPEEIETITKRALETWF